MASPNALSPNLPPSPMTVEQRKLFDRYLPLARRMKRHGVHKYGSANRAFVQSAALTGLMCACVRYRTPSNASFGTFAIRTINWMMRIEVMREAGRKQPRTKPCRTAGFDASAYRAAGELPDAFWEPFEEAFVTIDRTTPEQLLETAERQTIAKRIFDEIGKHSPRELEMLKRQLDGDTMADIARDYRLSRERVRQLIARALKRAVTIAAPLQAE